MRERPKSSSYAQQKIEEAKTLGPASPLLPSLLSSGSMARRQAMQSVLPEGECVSVQNEEPIACGVKLWLLSSACFEHRFELATGQQPLVAGTCRGHTSYLRPNHNDSVCYSGNLKHSCASTSRPIDSLTTTNLNGRKGSEGMPPFPNTGD